MSIRIQADNFLKAYQTLTENYDTKTLAIMEPSIVCLAFSVELYIKDLLNALNCKVPKKHKIYELYESLPDTTKEEIFCHPAISKNPFMTRGNPILSLTFSHDSTSYDGFVEQINMISDGFEKWRYSYESSTLHYDSSFALAFIEAVRTVADCARKK